jgi:hypothetical protein
MYLNKSLTVLEEKNNSLLLKIGNSDKFVKMSNIEFDIIKSFSKLKDFQNVISAFSDVVEIEESQLSQLIDKAKENQILTDSVTDKKEFWITTVYKRKKKLFEVLKIDFTGTRLERIFENKTSQILFASFLITASIFMAVNLLSEPLSFQANYIETLYNVPIPFSKVFGFIYLSTFLSICIHEFGHYFFYKILKGRTSLFGFGMLFFVIPIFYNKVLTGLIKKRSERMLINAGGFIFDLILVIFLIYFTKEYHVDFPTLSFLFYCAMISIAIRTFFGMNIFLPGSDGYYIFTEMVKKDDLFDESALVLKSLLKPKSFNLKKIHYALYALFSYIFILFSWSFILIPIIVYIYYAF